MALEKIISGGQTGVDRGALKAALDKRFPCGGWCPEGRLSESGPIPKRYPVKELPRAGYPERTWANARESDGTLILCPGMPEGGTDLTVKACRKLHMPYLVIDTRTHTPAQAAIQIRPFIRRYRIRHLNVAGPRASGWPEAERYAREVIARVLPARKEKTSVKAQR